MFGLALRSLRMRAGGFAASFLAMFLGAAILMAFASMLDTARAGKATGAARETLVTMAIVVGFWGLLLVILAVTSTLTLSVRQRAEEMALLKSVGATPAQIGRMVVGEAAGLAVAAWALAVLPGFLAGAGLLELLHSTDQVPESVSYAFGPVALAMGLAITLLSAVGAAVVTVRRTVRGRVAESLADAGVGRSRMGKARVAGGIVFLLLGLNLAVVTSTVMRNEGTDAMATAGQADILAALGLALLGPWLIRRTAGALARPLGAFGVAGDLAVSTLRRRTGQMASVVMPIILFTGIAVGTLYLQEIENDAMAAAGLVSTVEQKNIATLNFVVIGMLLFFTALMLVNTLIAATAYRRAEFGQQRLAGATPGQVLGAVTLEGVLLTGIGLACGTFAALFTVLPFGIARADTALPDLEPLTYVAVALIAVVLTMASALGAARRAVRVPAVEAVSI
ncbi:ABC transporter permease [Actinomadura vinacea]|uniref:ABC transporter permease n=1 Tax=Actinomadura vinacea TaxID=115336 RepID=A0ABN3IUZ4_9ACTN